MPRTRKAVPANAFNYGLFRVDLMKKCKEFETTLADLSSKKFYRNPNYLSAVLHDKAVPLDIIIALCDMFSLNARDYEPQKAVTTSAKVVEEKPKIPANSESVEAILSSISDGIFLLCKILKENHT